VSTPAEHASSSGSGCSTTSLISAPGRGAPLGTTNERREQTWKPALPAPHCATCTSSARATTVPSSSPPDRRNSMRGGRPSSERKFEPTTVPRAGARSMKNAGGSM
jgi:hypothetical protein